MDFLSQWLKRFELSAAHWRQEVQRHTAALPFISPEVSVPLLKFLFAKAPGIVSRCGYAETRLLADAYGWCCFALWQCESAFPSLPENYALHLQAALAIPPAERDRSAVLLARMAVEWNATEGRCGFNRFRLADPETIRNSEALNHKGRYEVYLKAREKYDEYVYYLEQSPEFSAEWAAIKTAFPDRCASQTIIRRSPIPERNWQQGPGAEFSTMDGRFQALFDFFCWKYFLWGMESDTPLLLKTTAVVTPYGTQIFIPGYLSFDSRRDLNFPAIIRLHRARGVSRQGPGYSIGRRELAELRQKVLAADEGARSKGLKGAARYRYICDATGYRDQDDFRRLRKLMASAKKNPTKPKKP